MRIRNVNDDFDWSDVLRRLALLESAAPAGFTSITRGSLRVASEDGLIVEGTALVTGLLRVIGRVLVQGLGILEVASLIELTGMLRVVGEILVPTGGKITVGDIRIEGGKIYVGTGGSQIVIDGASGEIQAGSMTISPTSNGGSVKFAGGPEVYASGDTLYLYSTSAGSFVEVGGTVKINGPGARYLEVDGSGFQFVGLPTDLQSNWPGSFPGAVVSDGSGNLYRIVPG